MDQIQTYQPLLFSIAYRMTGYASQAEDIVQDAYLRYQQADQAAIQSPKSYLTTIVTNLSLNYLKSARRAREEYIGIWLPEPVLTSLSEGESPEERYEQQESISLAFLVLLESLTPPERAVFLLHEVFDYPFAEIAEIIEKTPEHCRQLFHRAKTHIAQKRRRVDRAPIGERRLLCAGDKRCNQVKREEPGQQRQRSGQPPRHLAVARSFCTLAGTGPVAAGFTKESPCSFISLRPASPRIKATNASAPLGLGALSRSVMV